MVSNEAIAAAGEAFLSAKIAYKGELGGSSIALLAALAAAEPHMFAAKAVAGVLDIHREVPCRDEDGELIGGSYCEECKDLDDHSGERVHEVYPCQTVREITAALKGEPTFTDMRRRIEGAAK